MERWSEHQYGENEQAECPASRTEHNRECQQHSGTDYQAYRCSKATTGRVEQESWQDARIKQPATEEPCCHYSTEYGIPQAIGSSKGTCQGFGA